MTLKYKIENQVFRQVGDLRHTVELSVNFVYLELEFDAEWDGANITVLFANDAVENGKQYQKTWTGAPMAVPAEVLAAGTLRLGCVGVRDGGETRITTARMERGICVRRAGGVLGVSTEAQTPEIWEQALAAIGQLSALETTDKSSLVAAVNETLALAGSGGGTGNVASAQISEIVVLDRAEYEALESRPASTLYLVRG